MMDDSDCLMECPYNMSHRVQKSRMQTHLFKCRKHSPSNDLVRCPFSANHDVPRAELNHHLELCSYRGTVQNHLAQTVSERTPVIMAYVAPVLPSEGENWDCDEPVQTYDPTAKNMSNKVLRALQGASKSERKHHRVQERLRFTAVAENGGLEGAVGYDENCNLPIPEEKHAYKYNQEVRQPKTKSKTFAIPPDAVAKPQKMEKNGKARMGNNGVQEPAQDCSLPPIEVALAQSPEKSPAVLADCRGTGTVKKTSVVGGVKASNPEKTSHDKVSQQGEPAWAKQVPQGPIPTKNKVVFSVDTGAGVPIPNLERDFPALGRGRGRLRDNHK